VRCSYGRGGERGSARPEVLQTLLSTTQRVVQQIDSVEYGLTDIQVGLLWMAGGCACVGSKLPQFQVQRALQRNTNACKRCLCVFKCCLRSILMQRTGRPELEV
jgi:hypothetical protein